MILPMQAALERVPGNLVEASADLGASPGQTFRTVILPLALPGIVAGSIFTFSLTLGDYIIPQIVGTSRLFIGQAVYAQQGTAGNIPLAAAFTVVPIVIMGVYLWAPTLGASMRSERHRPPPLPSLKGEECAADRCSDAASDLLRGACRRSESHAL